MTGHGRPPALQFPLTTTVRGGPHDSRRTPSEPALARTACRGRSLGPPPLPHRHGRRRRARLRHEPAGRGHGERRRVRRAEDHRRPVHARRGLRRPAARFRPAVDASGPVPVRGRQRTARPAHRRRVGARARRALPARRPARHGHRAPRVQPLRPRRGRPPRAGRRLLLPLPHRQVGQRDRPDAHGALRPRPHLGPHPRRGLLPGLPRRLLHGLQAPRRRPLRGRRLPPRRLPLRVRRELHAAASAPTRAATYCPPTSTTRP